MRLIHSMMLGRRAAVLCLLVLSIGVLGCPEHSDFPTQLDLVVPPTPTSFVITDVGPNPISGYDYDLSWTVSDPTNVDRYRIYSLQAGLPPHLESETTSTSIGVTLPLQISGLRLSVAAVSTGNVEGHSAIAETP